MIALVVFKGSENAFKDLSRVALRHKGRLKKQLPCDIVRLRLFFVLGQC